MDYREFYTELGKLLYAVAKADGEVQDEELHKIYQMVVKDLSDASLFDRENEVDAYYTEFEFEALIDQNTEMTVALQSFLEFFDENEDSFTDDMKAISLRAMEHVAEAFDGIVPEEQALIDELSAKFKK
jgi:tellurite resistance protein